MSFKKSNIILIFALILISSFINITNILTASPQKFSEKDKQYFLDIALGTDYGDNLQKIKKWTVYIKIYPEFVNVNPRVRTALKYELQDIINDINELTNNIKLHLVSSEDAGNVFVHFGSAQGYADKVAYNKNYAPPTLRTMSEEESEALKTKILNLTKDNSGLTWCYWNRDFEIMKSAVFVDTTREDIQASKHILRENIAKSLGLLNESDKYDKSIFYGKWSTVGLFQPIDKKVIEILYSDKIKAGMTREEVIEILKDM